MKTLQYVSIGVLAVGVFLALRNYQKSVYGAVTMTATQYGRSYDDNITGNQSSNVVYL